MNLLALPVAPPLGGAGMELRHLRYFIAVAEDLSFSRGAERLRVAQSSLSRQIQDLEEEIGVQLISRQRPHIELTAAGAAFLTDARKLVASSLQAIDTARRADRGEVGRLDIGYIGVLSDGLIPRLLRLFRSRFPNVAVTLNQIRPARQVEALFTRQIHLGFIGLPIRQHEPGLMFEVFRRDPMCAALPAGHAFLKRRRLTLKDLAGERFIFLTRAGTPTFYDWLMALCHRAGFHPNIVQEVESGQSVVELVASGLGIALFSATAQASVHSEVVFHPLSGPLPKFQHSVAWHRGEETPSLRAFLDLLRKLESATETR